MENITTQDQYQLKLNALENHNDHRLRILETRHSKTQQILPAHTSDASVQINILLRMSKIKEPPDTHAGEYNHLKPTINHSSNQNTLEKSNANISYKTKHNHMDGNHRPTPISLTKTKEKKDQKFNPKQIKILQLI